MSTTHYSSSRQHIIGKYRIPNDIKRGTRVLAFGKIPGMITGFDGGYVVARLEGYKHPQRVHPLELAYNGEDWNAALQRQTAMNERIAWFNGQLAANGKIAESSVNDG